MLGVGFSLHADLAFLALAREILEDHADYFEVNPEAMWRSVDGRLVRNDYRQLFEQIRTRSGKRFVAHGLAFSPGSAPGVAGEAERTATWLERIADDHATFDFAWMSEHLGYVEAGGLQAVLPLPLPFTQEAVDACVSRLRLLAEIVPDVAFENSANYCAFGDVATIEPGFLNAIARHTPCWMMLDLHNVYTQAVNFGFDPAAYVDDLDLSRVIQIPLSGGSLSDPDWLPSRRVFRLDSHDGAIPDEVWDLLDRVIPKCTALRGIVVERLNGTFEEADLPGLVDEIARARAALGAVGSQPSAGTADDPAPLDPGPSLASLQRGCVRALIAAHPERAVTDPPVDLDPEARSLLATADPDGFRITGLIVRKLRFERLTMGDDRFDAWFEHDPEGFVAPFEAYCQQVPPTAYFPTEEAALFHAWRRETGVDLPGWVERGDAAPESV